MSELKNEYSFKNYFGYFTLEKEHNEDEWDKCVELFKIMELVIFHFSKIYLKMRY